MSLNVTVTKIINGNILEVYTDFSVTQVYELLRPYSVIERHFNVTLVEVGTRRWVSTNGEIEVTVTERDTHVEDMRELLEELPPVH